MARGPLLFAGLVVLSSRVLTGAELPQDPTPARRPLVLDAVVFDQAGRTVTDLTAAEFRVTIDGQPRQVASVRYVFRGPEASKQAASAAARTGQETSFESSRAILIVVDEAGLPSSGEKQARSVVSTVLDLLGRDDGAALVLLPGAVRQVALTQDLRSLRAAVGSVRGRAVQYRLLAEAVSHQESPVASGAADDEPERERQGALAQRAPGLARELATNAEAGTTDPTSRPNLTPLQSLARIVAGLRGVKGLKSIVFITGGLSPQESMRTDPKVAMNAVREAAAVSRSTVHLVRLSRSTSVEGPERELERMAGDTGGTVSRIASGNSAPERLLAALSGGYLLEVAEQGEVGPGRTRAVTLAVSRPGIELAAPARWLARDDPRAGLGVATPEPASPAGSAQPDARRGKGTSVTLRRPAPAPDPELMSVFGRMSDYVANYLRDFSSVVAEETYEQSIEGFTRTATANMPYRFTRRMVSDLLLIRVEGPDVWVPFRDVLSVDGKPVRDREARLRKLFLEEPGRALREARRITEESARYNLGPIFRTLNLPTLPLVFLMPAHVSSFVFQRKGEEPVEGAVTLRIDYRETEKPTVIRRAGSNENMPASGSLWVDAPSGRIVRTLVKTTDGLFEMETTVTYRPDADLGLWVPAEMSEVYRQRGGTITCTARYSHFRHFQVTTEEKIKIQKD